MMSDVIHFIEKSKPELPTFDTLPPFSVYIHVPWCLKKCPYCDFNSHVSRIDIPEDRYIKSLQSDLEQALPEVLDRNVTSIFIGGGTPSLLSEKAIEIIMNMLRSHLKLAPNVEVTLEANPSSIETKKFSSYAANGITRFSIGIQSFNENLLKSLGRSYSRKEAITAVKTAQSYSDYINIDMMFGLPGQKLPEFKKDLQQALMLCTNHVSFYELTIEKNTIFSKHRPFLPNDNTKSKIEFLMQNTMEDFGFKQYEVSSYAKNSAICKHNLNYWKFGDYLGLGPGAHSKISFRKSIIRQMRNKNPTNWMNLTELKNGTHITWNNSVNSEHLVFEFMLNALRIKDGVPINLFSERTGLSLSILLPKLLKAVKQGLLVNNLNKICPSSFGWNFLSDLQEIFL